MRIESAWTPKGLQGLVERAFTLRMLTPLYQEQLRLLDLYARKRSDA